MASSLALFGCTQTLNLDAVRAAVEEGLELQLGVPIVAVTCPEGREVKADDSFDCTAAGEHEGQVVVKVTQANDHSNVKWEIVRSSGYLNLNELAEQITQDIEERTNTGVTVICGGHYREAVRDATFECTVTDLEGTALPVIVTVVDTQGTLDWRVASRQ